MAFPEQYANAASSPLSGAITSGATSMAVTSGSLYSQVPQFRVQVESEYILVTGVTGNVWAIVRGVEGTTPAAHANGVVVTQIVTAVGFAGVCGLATLTGTYGNLPATGVIGRTYQATDSPYLLREGASGWVGYGPLYPMTSPPPLSGWTWSNQGTATAVQQGAGGGPIHLHAPAAAGNNRRLLTMVAPATGYTIIAAIVPEVWMQQYPGCGVGWRDSVTDKQAFLVLHGDTGANGGLQLRAIYSGGSTTFYNSYVTFGGSTPRLMWVKLQDDGVNRTLSYSWNGFDFIQLDQRARKYYDGSTLMEPDQVMFFAESISSTYDAGITLYSWTVTHP